MKVVVSVALPAPLQGISFSEWQSLTRPWKWWWVLAELLQAEEVDG